MDLLKPMFGQLILRDQDCFSTDEQASVLLELLGDEEFASTFRDKWSLDLRSSKLKWNDLLVKIRQEAAKGLKNPTYSVSAVFPLQDNVLLLRMCAG